MVKDLKDAKFSNTEPSPLVYTHRSLIGRNFTSVMQKTDALYHVCGDGTGD